MLLNIDVASLEWVGGAELSGDEVMQQEIIDGVDIHSANALACFGSLDFRQEAKVVSFRSLYCGSPYAFFMDTNMPKRTLDEWEQIQGNFYKKYKRLGQWQNELYDLVCKQGWYQSFTGRRYIFHKEKGKYSKPSVGNYIIQGTCTGDLIPFAMMLMRKQVKDLGLDAQMICTVHDSVVFDVAKEDVDKLAEVCWNTIYNLPASIKSFFGYDWKTPLTSEVEIGMNYKELTKIYGKKGRVANVSDIFC